MTLILNSKDVEKAINMRSIIQWIEKGVVEERNGSVEMPPRVNMSTNNLGFFRLMPAVLNESGIMGYKAFAGSRKTGKTRYAIALMDQEENDMIAMMDAHYLTAVRTGATTGLATKYLARENAKKVGVIGSGFEARTNLEGVCAVRNIEQVKVFSPTPHRRELFAQEMSGKLNVQIEAVDSAVKAVEGVDIVIVATNTSSKGGSGIAFEGNWIQPGMHVNSIGSTMPVLREIDAESFARADFIIVDTLQVEEESGDVLDALKQGKYDRTKVIHLKEIVAGGRKVRTDDQQVTLFKSVGTAIQDIMAAQAVYEEARRLGLGTDVGEFLELKLFS